jgi:hypothetical protein
MQCIRRWGWNNLSKLTVALAKICAIYDDKHFVKSKDSQFKKIFKCADLNGLYVSNSKYLIPYYTKEGYSQTFQNNNGQYDVFTGLDNSFSELLEKRDNEKMGQLLVELGKEIPVYPFENIDEDDALMKKLDELKGLYEIAGYRLTNDATAFYVEPYSGNAERLSDISDIEKWLENSFEGVFTAYKGAMDSFVSNNYGTCIESCRTVLTGIFSKYRGTEKFAKWVKGIANVSGEMTDVASLNASIHALGKSDLADFFEENATGSYKKTKAIYSIYSMMSDYGPHREEGTIESPSKADALMMYRMMQDIVLWIYQTKEQ